MYLTFQRNEAIKNVGSKRGLRFDLINVLNCWIVLVMPLIIAQKRNACLRQGIEKLSSMNKFR